jgi:hypothetical protein
MFLLLWGCANLQSAAGRSHHVSMTSHGASNVGVVALCHYVSHVTLLQGVSLHVFMGHALW